MVRRDVVDVLLDHDLDEEHGEDVPGRLEQPLVVPAVLALERSSDPVVLAQEQHPHDHEAELEVAGVAPEREQLAALVVGERRGPHNGDLVEHLAVAVVEVGRELLPAALLREQQSTLA